MNIMQTSIFTKIANQEIPGVKVYEDDLCYVLMTHEPINPGHCLVIPHREIDHVWDLPDDLYAHLMSVSKQIANKMRKNFDYKRIGMSIEGFGVPHAHIHIFGYTQPLEETIREFSNNKLAISVDEMQAAAEQLNQ